MHPQMIRQLVNPSRQERDLYFRRPGIPLVATKILEDSFFGFFCECHVRFSLILNRHQTDRTSDLPVKYTFCIIADGKNRANPRERSEQGPRTFAARVRHQVDRVMGAEQAVLAGPPRNSVQHIF